MSIQNIVRLKNERMSNYQSHEFYYTVCGGKIQAILFENGQKWKELYKVPIEWGSAGKKTASVI